MGNLNMKQNQIVTALKTAIAGLIVCAASATLPASQEEFVGPFASWRNLKRDYAAAGGALRAG